MFAADPAAEGVGEEAVTHVEGRTVVQKVKVG